MRFDILKLKGRLALIRDWMSHHHFPLRLLVIIMGIISTIWFLVRVIPKPSRASYPCMRVAAPFMSGLITYLLAVGALTFASRRLSRKIINVRLLSTILLLWAVMIAVALTPSDKGTADLQIQVKNGPDDGPNQPFGTALGIKPGRVVWDWDTAATNSKCHDYYFIPENTKPEVVGRMFNRSVMTLTGESSVKESWDAMFRYFNKRKNNEDKGYEPGEKIFIKINQTSGRGRLREAERNKGNFDYPGLHDPGARRNDDLGTCETSPFIVLQILRQLVNECGVAQSDIAVGDPQNPTYDHNYAAWSAEFPNVVYTDRTTGNFGRTLIHPTKTDLLFYSDKYQTDKLYDIIENADYLINVANLKPHSGTGITLTAKNHFGSQSRAGAYHLHYSHLCQIEGKPPTNAGYHKYRVLVDLMGSRYLGRNTLLYVIDGLYAGGSSEGGPPVKYFMSPFNGNWSNSIFISLDQVALESVCYDFLRTEWNGSYSHDASNNSYEAMPFINGVDDYLHQAADSANWPEGITYDPDNSGKPIPSLGVHEHWNNPVNKQYSRNLGKNHGIELVSIPTGIVGNDAPKMTSITGIKKTEQVKKQKSRKAVIENIPVANAGGIKIDSVIRRTIAGKNKPVGFIAGALDDDNRKWFLTDAGIVSGNIFSVLDNLRILKINDSPFDELTGMSISERDMRGFTYELSEEGPGLWIATSEGAIKALIPKDTMFQAARIFNTTNSSILSNNVLSVTHGRNQLRWFGTDKGISALAGDKWLTPSYSEQYPDVMFSYFPVTAMSTSHNGDTLYAGSAGGGVSRFYRNEVDAISGASQYMQWGPIDMPSDTVLSICIARDGTQWIGTTQGVARHTGNNTLENWTVFDKSNGLADNHVQAIAADPYGRHVWVGTKGGVSVFDNAGWTSFTTKDGLISNNILFIIIDKNGLVYMGTDKGIMIYSEGQLVCYQ